MGFNQPQWKFINKCFRENGLIGDDKKLPFYKKEYSDEKYYGMKMLELGCQVIRPLVRNSLRAKGSSRSYFRSIGIKCTSVDIRGCLGSRKVDLRKPIGNKYHNTFDIITNSGTTEHIIPVNGQYQAFKNIHIAAKKGSIMIHILPGIGTYYGHCQTYYDRTFFEELSKVNNYKIVFIEPIKNRKAFVWMGVCLVKMEDNKFTEDKKAFMKYIQFISKSKMKKHRKNKQKYMYLR